MEQGLAGDELTKNDKIWPKLANFFGNLSCIGDVKSVMLIVMVLNNGLVKQAAVVPAAAEVTVPDYRVFKADPVSYELTDYALDIGARVIDAYTDEQGQRHAIGETWVRGTQGHHFDALTYWDTYSLPCDQIFAREIRAAGDGQVGVAPCFVNPDELGIATQEIGGQSVVTIYNRFPYYPQVRVRDRHLRNELARHKKLMDAKDNVVSDVYALPHYQRDIGSEHGEVGVSPVCCYHYQGNSYVYVNGEWYRSEPIKARYQADGSIQCDNLLFPSPRGNGRGDKTLYSFLNNQFISDLVKHSRAKLSQLQIDTTKGLLATAENSK